MIKLAIVSPCYNEEEVLEQSAARLTALFDELVGKEKISADSFVLFVNDGSKDRTWNIIKKLHKENPYVKGMNLARNVGHQSAIMAGMMTAKDWSDAVVTIDADLQDDLNAIEEMIDAYTAGYDVVYGVKVSRQADPLLKRLSATAFYKLQRRMGVESIYNHADFRFLSRRVLEQLSHYQERNLYLRGIIPLLGFPSTTVDDVIRERTAGSSKYTLRKMLGLALDGITSFSVKPIYGIVYLGIIFVFIYNVGSSILRAMGDSRRPLYYLIVCCFLNIVLDIVLVIVFHMGVAGVAIGTIISQLISCVLVLTCLYRSEGSYQLRFSKLKINGAYMEQIFQVGVPAGIQSTVINLSNALLQSSVNSFGSIAMAGYTAANNILGFLYMSVNSITQACMSFTSQNYGVGKLKRMDKVLRDCAILSIAIAAVLGGLAYSFGPQILTVYTSDPKVINCGMEILAYTSITYFLCGIMDLFPGALRGMGYSAVPMVLSVIGTVGTRIVWVFGIFPNHRSLSVLFVSYPVSWIITIVLQVVCFYFVRKRVHQKEKRLL